MNESEMKAVVFQLNKEEYGVNVHQVISIERMQEITRVPRAPEFVAGVMNLRGVVTPVIDLRRRFSLEETDYTEESRIIVVRVGEIEAGLIVDGASDVIDIPEGKIESTSEVVGGVKAEYLQGVAKLDERLLILLNLDKVLHPEEVKELETTFEEK